MTPAATKTEKPTGNGKAQQAPARQQQSLLPTEKTEPSLKPETAKVLLYGPPKIGKSTLAASVDPDHTLFLATEAGLGALSVYAKPIASWEEFREVGPELIKGGHPFKRIVVDTVDELHKFCTEKVLRDLNIAHPADLEYGKGWSAVTDEFRLRVGALCALGLGVWFVSHAKDEEVKKRTGPITVTRPSLPGGASKWLSGFVDFILLERSEATDDGEQRVLRTQPTENYEAGARLGAGVLLTDPIPVPLEDPAGPFRADVARALGGEQAKAGGDAG